MSQKEITEYYAEVECTECKLVFTVRIGEAELTSEDAEPDEHGEIAVTKTCLYCGTDNTFTVPQHAPDTIEIPRFGGHTLGGGKDR